MSSNINEKSQKKSKRSMNFDGGSIEDFKERGNITCLNEYLIIFIIFIIYFALPSLLHQNRSIYPNINEEEVTINDIFVVLKKKQYFSFVVLEG